MLAHTPPLGAAALTLIYAVLSHSELDPVLREIVILRVAQRSQAAYALSQHSAIARSVGVSAAQVSSLAAGATPDELFDERQRAAVAFVDESLDRSQTSEETWRLALQHFNPRQLVELLLTAGCFRMMSRLVSILELEMEPPFGVDTLRRAHDIAELGNEAKGPAGRAGFLSAGCPIGPA